MWIDIVGAMRERQLILGLVVYLAAAIASMTLPASAVEPQTVAKLLESSVVRILVIGPGNAASGSGFVLSRRGHIATNFHVVEPHVESGWEIFVLESGAPPDDRLPATLIKAFPGEDLAVLQVDGLNRPVVTLSADADTTAKGMSVYAIGFPSAGTRLGPSLETSFTTGALNRLITGSWTEGGPQIQIIQHSAPTNPGNSGGPVVNACGQVIGINSRRETAIVFGPGGLPIATDFIQGVFFASHVSVLTRKLDKLGVPYAGTRKVCRVFLGIASTNWVLFASAAVLFGIALTILIWLRPQPVVQVVHRCKCAAEDTARAVTRALKKRR